LSVLVLKTPREPLGRDLMSPMHLAGQAGARSRGPAIWYEFLFGSKPQAASNKLKIKFDIVS